MPTTNEQELLQSIQKIMQDFKEGGRLRDKEGRRIARRTAQIVRWSSVGMVLLGVAFLSLLLILTKDIVLIRDNIIAMSNYTQSMSKDMHSMVGTMTAIKKDMGAMKYTMNKLGTETELMRKSIKQINTSIEILPVMNGNVATMSQEFKVLSNQMAWMTQLMNAMRKDTHQMSKPLRMMPWR